MLAFHSSCITSKCQNTSPLPGAAPILDSFANSSISLPKFGNLERVLLTDFGTRRFRSDFFATYYAKTFF